MARGFTLDLIGLKPTIDLLRKKGRDIEAEVEDEIEQAAINIEKLAVQRVAKDAGAGGLSGVISRKRIDPLNYEVVAPKKYAAYVEFGTGKLVKVPKGLESYAMQFKGKGIKEVNLPARPFLFNSYTEESKALLKRLKAILKAVK